MAAGLYIHVPFCRSKCSYCNFYSVTLLEKSDEYIEALLREVEMYRCFFQHQHFDTVYLGGGTPSLLSEKQIETILNGLHKCYTIGKDVEITMEVNPADLNDSWLASLRIMGINRLNIGIQSFDAAMLKFLGRRHSTKESRAAVERARKNSFENIGIDLLYGLPGQSIQSWETTLNEGIAFNPEHLSCYQLTLEAGTSLGERCRQGTITLPNEKLQYDFFMQTSEVTEKYGYMHYEVSNFARSQAYCSRHNQKYWDHSPYLGLGPSAHSFFAPRRWWNHRSLDHYIRKIKKGKPPVAGTESLNAEQLQIELISLGLRTSKGIQLETVKATYGYDLLSHKQEIIAMLTQEKFIEINDCILQPTRKGLALADSISLMLC